MESEVRMQHVSLAPTEPWRITEILRENWPANLAWNAATLNGIMVRLYLKPPRFRSSVLDAVLPGRRRRQTSRGRVEFSQITSSAPSMI